MPPNLEGQTLDEAFPQETPAEQESPLVEEETTKPETPSEETKPSETESKETKEASEESKETADEEEVEEPKVPFYRLREKTQEVRELRAKIAERERQSSLTDDERYQLDEDKKLEQKLDAYLARKEAEKSAKDESDADELIELMELYGKYDVDKVLDIKSQYKVSNNEAAVKLYFKLFGTGSKPKGEPKQLQPKEKVPQPKGSAPVQSSVKPVDVSSKSLSQLVEEAKKEFDLK